MSNADQGENLEDYLGTVTVLARPFIIKHPDKDIRLTAACCLAHVLRIYAPDAPYDKNQLWVSIIVTKVLLGSFCVGGYVEKVAGGYIVEDHLRLYTKHARTGATAANFENDHFGRYD